MQQMIFKWSNTNQIIQTQKKCSLFFIHHTKMDEYYFSVLTDPKRSIGERYQSISHLRNISTQSSINLLIQAYNSAVGSVLLTHQILYSLGQLNESFVGLVKDFLFEKASDQSESNVARHQAAQSLANYYHLIPDLDQFYAKYLTCGKPELQDTCKISIEKVKHPELVNRYGLNHGGTKQPAAPFTQEEFQTFLDQKELQGFYMNMGFLGLLLKPQEEISLYEKYRIMYYMRDLGTKNEIRVFCQILSKKYFRNQSRLLKHEICFIMGQIGCDQYEEMIRECMENEEQAEIVRHEALAAVASHGRDIDYLKKFTSHQNRLIRESAQVAEFMIKYYIH